MSRSTISSFKKMLHLIDRRVYNRLFLMVACSSIVSMLEVATAVIVGLLAQALVNPESAYQHLYKVHLVQSYHPQKTVLFIALFCGFVYLIKNVFAATDVYYQEKMAQGIAFSLRQRLLNKYTQLSEASYFSQDVSSKFTMLTDKVDRLARYGLRPAAIIFSESLIFAMLVLFIVYISPILFAIIFGVGGVASLLLMKFVFPFCYRLGTDLDKRTTSVNGYLMQLLYSFKEVILFGKEKYFRSRFDTRSVKLARTWSLHNAMEQLPRLAIEVLFIGLFVLSICYLCLSGTPTAHIMIVMGGYLYIASRLMPGLNRLIFQMNNLKSTDSVIDAITEELDQTKVSKYQLLDEPQFSFNDAIYFKDVVFSYQDSHRYIVDHASFKIKKGACIGIVGGTGMGKSTLINLLLGFLVPNKGEITIDHRYPVNCQQWHSILGYVPQSIYLLDDTILANIAFGIPEEEVNRKRVDEVVAQAQLSTLINRLPLGLQTACGDRGEQLSGGERQRIAIARALYHNPEVLIFDEATSGLDQETESMLMKTIYQVTKNHTVIMVTHRVATLKNCDRIFTLKDGQLTEELVCAASPVL